MYIFSRQQRLETERLCVSQKQATVTTWPYAHMCATWGCGMHAYCLHVDCIPEL